MIKDKMKEARDGTRSRRGREKRRKTRKGK